MPNKSFSIYQSEKDSADVTETLVLEVAKTHLACISKDKKRHVSAFELFTFTDIESADFSKLFAAVTSNSKIIGQSFSSAEIYINNELSILVPIFKFNREIAVDYLNIVFGENADCKVQFEHLPVEPGMINVYRMQEQLANVLSNNFQNVTFKHSWSNIIKNILADVFTFPSEFIYVQFYTTFIIVTVIKDGKLQIIQSFIYEVPEDVLYNLLNIAQQFTLNNQTLTLQISGMIDLNFTMYRDLITYFKNVEVRNTEPAKVMAEIKEYPLHYFTPFFNLAL